MNWYAFVQAIMWTSTVANVAASIASTRSRRRMVAHAAKLQKIVVEVEALRAQYLEKLATLKGR